MTTHDPFGMRLGILIDDAFCFFEFDTALLAQSLDRFNLAIRVHGFQHVSREIGIHTHYYARLIWSDTTIRLSASRVKSFPGTPGATRQTQNTGSAHCKGYNLNPSTVLTKRSEAS